MGNATASYPPYQDASTSQTNPTTSTILADTGQMASGVYEVRVFVGCSVAAVFTVRHMNAANLLDTTDDPVLIRAAAGQTGEYVFKYAMNFNERLTVTPAASITGTAEASIHAFRVV